MFANSSVKERAVYFAIGAAVLIGISYFGGQNLNRESPMRIELPNKFQDRQGLVQSPTGVENGGENTSESQIAIVHVVGEVNRPGIYEFEPGKRVTDAIANAGGSSKEADLESVNLAAKLVDGTQLRIPRKSLEGAAQPLLDPSYSGSGSNEAYARTPTSKSSKAATGSRGLAPGSISINTASKSELDRLPGVGPSTAQKILDYRHQSGGFSSIDELLSVKGIGPKKLADMRKYLRL